MSLAHIGLETEIIPISFSEKDRIAFSGQELVPVLVDGETIQCDSWKIACYLDDTYPDTPSLFSASAARGTTRILNLWFDNEVVMSLFPLLAPDNYDVVLPKDMDYYIHSRYEWLGKTRDELEAERSEQKLID
jgi:glutathione S-transferase